MSEQKKLKKFDISKVRVLDIEGKEMWPTIVKANKGIEIDSLHKMIGTAIFNDSPDDDIALKGRDIFMGSKTTEITISNEKEFVASIKSGLNTFKPWVARSVLATGIVD